MSVFEADLAGLQPSKLYICEEKLATVKQAMKTVGGAITEPVPVKRMGSRVVLTDGHTRAVAALRQGQKTIPACWEADDLDWEAYGICVDWCLAECIHSVADLATRIVSAEQYEMLWYERCRALHSHLAKQGESIRTESG